MRNFLNRKIQFIQKNYLKHTDFFKTFDINQHSAYNIRDKDHRSVYYCDKNIPQELSPLLIKYFDNKLITKELIMGRLNRSWRIISAKHAYRAFKRLENTNRKITPIIYSIINFKKLFLTKKSIQFQEYIANSTTFETYFNSLTDNKFKLAIVNSLADILSLCHMKKVFIIDFGKDFEHFIVKDDNPYIIDLDETILLNPLNILSLHYQIYDLTIVLKKIKNICGKNSTEAFFQKYSENLKWSYFRTKIYYKYFKKFMI